MSFELHFLLNKLHDNEKLMRSIQMAKTNTKINNLTESATYLNSV